MTNQMISRGSWDSFRLTQVQVRGHVLQTDPGQIGRQLDQWRVQLLVLLNLFGQLVHFGANSETLLVHSNQYIDEPVNECAIVVAFGALQKSVEDLVESVGEHVAWLLSKEQLNNETAFQKRERRQSVLGEAKETVP